MKLTYKRILILFSVALNIGFLIMALFQAYQHTIYPKEQQRWKELMIIVRELNLPDAKAARAMETIARFRERMDSIETELKQARMEVLDLLAQTGPIDKERLHSLVQAAEMFSQKKRSMFEAHVIELRQVLGNGDGARFFIRLKEHIESKHAAHG